MEGEEGGLRLSKRINNGEVDYKNKSGTAWSHSYLNQKPWHPLSYPNQRRKWIAEQSHAQRQRRAEEVAREYSQEQDFFRQTSLISKKEKDKIEMMQAVSFMYVRPPGYNAESAKAAEIGDQSKQEEQSNGLSTSMPLEAMPAGGPSGEQKKKPRPKDVFGRALPTEQEFEVLKNAPRLDTGVPARSKPFGIEVRNVKCVRCGNYGHQSGDRECPLKDVIMPNEENRLKRNDPLNAILAHTDPSEPLKWELKQKPGMSPPRGGFRLDDPNQQIVAEEIFDEYGGFLCESNIPDLLTNFSSSKSRKKSKKKSKHRKHSSPSNRDVRAPEEDSLSSLSNNSERMSKKEKEKEKKHKKKKRRCSESSSSDDSELERDHKKKTHKNYSSEDSESCQHHISKRKKNLYSTSYEDDTGRYDRSEKNRHKHTPIGLSENDHYSYKHHRSQKSRKRYFYSSSSEYDTSRYHRSEKKREKHTPLGLSENDHQSYKHHRIQKRSSSEDDTGRHYRKEDRHKHSRTNYHAHKRGRSEKNRQKSSYLEDSDYDGHCRGKHNRRNHHHHHQGSE